MSELSLHGSCLCGSVTYEVNGSALNFFHCHCERCRKATGTGHASNIIMSPAKVKYLSGEDLVRKYKVPDARFFTNTFCEACGSRLPGFSAERKVAVIPAGSLDSDPGLLPDARIFADSAASWSCDTNELPTFDTYPPRP